MNLKIKSIMLLGGIVVFAILILGICYIKGYFLPVTDFSYRSEPSKQHENFAKSILSFDHQTYICDYDEWSLDILSETRGKVIGRDQEGNKIYKIDGQDHDDYVMFVDCGEMSNGTIFRKESISLINDSNIKFNVIEILNKKYNITNELTDEIVDSLKQLKESKLMIETQEVYAIRLISPYLKGIGYSINVCKYNNELYFKGRSFSECVKAGNIFSSWFTTVLSNKNN